MTIPKKIKETDVEVADVTKETDVETDTFAKAGKRSKKTVEAVEAEAERQARKSETKPDEEKKGPKPTIRPRSERRSKGYKKVAKKLDFTKACSLEEATKLATETSPVKFDATVEVHVRLDVDPKQADQNIRATVVLPHGTGKNIRVAAFAPKDLAVGADIAGEEEILALLDKENFDFDILITTPQNMPKLGKYARILGPKGLMPNPKTGTVSADIAKAIKEAKAGKIEYRIDKQSIIHLGIGKVSFGPAKLTENIKAFFASLNSNKPSSLKGNFIISASLSTSMGPGIKLDINTL